jgi:iron complex transport system substrate-binding protein
VYGGERIPGFFFDPFGLDVPPESELPAMWDGSWDKEMFYELDPDVFLADPNYFELADTWDESDSQEIAKNVAHWFGSNSRRRREFHDYTLYTLYECFEKCAALFRERDRYEAFVAIHDDLRAEIASRVPDERPTIGLINGGSNPATGEFFPLIFSYIAGSAGR